MKNNRRSAICCRYCVFSVTEKNVYGKEILCCNLDDTHEMRMVRMNLSDWVWEHEVYATDICDDCLSI